jgi:hypothetical protein
MRRVWVVLALLTIACEGSGDRQIMQAPLPPPPPPGEPPDAITAPTPDAAAVDAAGGAIWRVEAAGIDVDLYGVWGAARGDVYAVGTNGTILHTPGWRGLHVVEANFLDIVWGAGPGEVYVGSAVPGRGISAPIFRSTDGGASFAVIAGAGMNTVTALWGTSSTDVWIGVAASDSNLYHSSDRLATVEPWGQPLPQLVQVRGVAGDAGTVIVVRSDGLVMRSDDRMHWVSAASGVGSPRAIVSRGANAWIVGDSIARSTDRGLSWTPAASPPGTLYAAFALDANDVYAVGAAGAVLHATDGQTFNVETVPTTADLRGVWASGPHDVYVVGAAGTILHFSD